MEEALLRARGGTSSPTQATLNGITLLIGLTTLSAPYILLKSGIYGLLLNLLLPLVYWYCTILLAKCMQEDESLSGYESIAKKFMSKWSNRVIGLLFYTELIGNLVSSCISIGDTLTYLYPDPNLGFLHMRGRSFLVSIATLAILPTVLFNGLSSISYLSFFGVTCIVLNLVCLLVVGFTVQGFSHGIPGFKHGGVPLAIGVYSFSYAGIPLFPGIHNSMKKSTQFPKVVAASFVAAIACHFALGICGVLMFGTNTRQQVHLNMPQHLLASKVAIWTTVFLPITKFPLILTPVSSRVENRFIKNDGRFVNSVAAILIRLLLVLAIVLISLFLPFFADVVGIVGSFASIALCAVFPIIFYLRSTNARTQFNVLLLKLIVCLAFVAGFVGTIYSVKNTIDHMLFGKKADAS